MPEIFSGKVIELLICANGISMQYQKRGGRSITALQPLHLELESGKVAVIFGRSGSGKTTLLSILAGLLHPSEGSVRFGTHDLYAMPDKERSAFRSRNIGYIPQGQSGLAVLRVRENILLPASLAGIPDVAERAGALLEQTGMTALQEAFPHELSGGEMRRMAIARALICKPAAVFADEPTNDLDETNAQQILSMLQSAAREGAAVTIVTHEPFAAAYADVIYRIDNGTIIKEGCASSVQII